MSSRHIDAIRVKLYKELGVSGVLSTNIDGAKNGYDTRLTCKVPECYRYMFITASVRALHPTLNGALIRL